MALQVDQVVGASFRRRKALIDVPTSNAKASVDEEMAKLHMFLAGKYVVTASCNLPTKAGKLFPNLRSCPLLAVRREHRKVGVVRRCCDYARRFFGVFALQ